MPQRLGESVHSLVSVSPNGGPWVSVVYLFETLRGEKYPQALDISAVMVGYRYLTYSTSKFHHHSYGSHTPPVNFTMYAPYRC